MNEDELAAIAGLVEDAGRRVPLHAFFVLRRTLAAPEALPIGAETIAALSADADVGAQFEERTSTASDLDAAGLRLPFNGRFVDERRADLVPSLAVSRVAFGASTAYAVAFYEYLAGPLGGGASWVRLERASTVAPWVPTLHRRAWST